MPKVNSRRPYAAVPDAHALQAAFPTFCPMADLIAEAEAELKAEAHRAERLQAQMQEQAEALAALRREMGGGAEGPVGPSLPDTPRPQPKGIRELQEEKLSSWSSRALSEGEQEKQGQSA